MCGRSEVRINEDQMGTTKRRSSNEHHKRLAEIDNRTQQSLQTFVSFYLLNKMLRNVGIILLVEFSKYLESFSMIWSGTRYIRHKQFGLPYFSLNHCVYTYMYVHIYVFSNLLKCMFVFTGGNNTTNSGQQRSTYFLLLHFSIVFALRRLVIRN